MISILQSLLSIQQFNFYFYKKQYIDSSDTKKKPVHNQMHRLLKQIIESGASKQEVKEFASCFESKFNPYEQHDAQEFFLHLVNLLQEEMKLEVAVPKSFKDP